MAMFRKKPVVIEAVQYTGDNHANLVRWMNNGLDPQMNAVGLFDGFQLRIRTLESGGGFNIADVGDFVIKGVKGEFYPCKPDIFAATYDPA